jgi:hypothetical protein
MANLLKRWWPGTELNRRRQPFQGCALPIQPNDSAARCRPNTYLSSHNAPYRRFLITLRRFKLVPSGTPGRMRPLAQCLQDLHGNIRDIPFSISDLVGPCGTRCTGGHWCPHMLQRFCWPILPCPMSLVTSETWAQLPEPTCLAPCPVSDA